MVDASAVAEAILQRPRGKQVEAAILSAGETLHAPHFIGLEVMHVLRRVAAAGEISQAQAMEAVAAVAALSVRRHEHEELFSRIWALRHNFTVYDASYVALAEVLGGRLLTLDMRLAAAVRTHTRVRLV